VCKQWVPLQCCAPFSAKWMWSICPMSPMSRHAKWVVVMLQRGTNVDGIRLYGGFKYYSGGHSEGTLRHSFESRLVTIGVPHPLLFTGVFSLVTVSLRSQSRSWQKLKKSRTQIYMDLSYIDPQARVLNYYYK